MARRISSSVRFQEDTRAPRHALVLCACRPHMGLMMVFDYMAPAQLYHPLRLGRQAPLGFHRFDTSAQAIKFAVEELTPIMLRGATLEVADDRLDGAGIRELYDDGAFPLDRRPEAASPVQTQAPATKP